VTTRRGFTLIEIIAVLALLLLLAAVAVPSIAAFRTGSYQRAASDQIRGELAAARAHAKQEGRPYRVGLSQDGTRIRRAPDDGNFESATASSQPGASTPAVDYVFENHVTATIIADPITNATPPVPTNDWITVATLQPDGTCLEQSALIQIEEKGKGSIYLRLRGLTASVRSVASPTSPTTGGAP
jgi:prepilin-type N-terminal cleavage/methylation domain-containing protein